MVVVRTLLSKGGDIDLLIVANDLAKDAIDRMIFTMLNEIKKSPAIGERRIDLKVATTAELMSDPFLKMIAGTMLKL